MKAEKVADFRREGYVFKPKTQKPKNEKHKLIAAYHIPVWYKRGVQRFSRLAADISRYSPGRSILEIGPGDGELAELLIAGGSDYVGVDRKPRIDLANIVTAEFMQYESGKRFDCVVTQYMLHHAPSIEAFVNRMLGFTKDNGVIAIGEYGWERSDDPTFRDERRDLHTSETMLSVLDRMLEQIHYEDVPYKDGDDTIGFIWLGRRRRLSPMSS